MSDLFDYQDNQRISINNPYIYYDLKADYISLKMSNKQILIESHFKKNECKLISGIPSELIAIFLLSQSNNDCELKFKSKGIEKTIQLQNIEKLGSKFADVLIGVELNEHVITREMQLLNSQIIRAKGAPLKKSSIDVLIKSYSAFREWFISNKKSKMSLRALISSINKENAANGKQNLNILMQLLLLSKTELYSSQDDKILLPMSRLFTIVSEEADAQEAIRDLIRESREKKEVQKRGGKRSGRLMDVCKNIYIDFSGGAFESLFLNHSKKTSKGIRAKGSFFRYDQSLGNSEARMCALLDLYRPYNRKHGSDGSLIQMTLAKTFSFNSITAISGQATEAKKDPKRFKETCKIAASVFGAISYTNSNFSIVYGQFSASEPFAEDSIDLQNPLRKNSEPFAEEKDGSQNPLRSFSEPFAETEQIDLTDTSIKTPLVSIVRSNTLVITSIQNNLKPKLKANDEIKPNKLQKLSCEVEAFLNTLDFASKKRELARIKKFSSIEKYEAEVKASKGFFKFSKKFNDNQIEAVRHE